MRCSPSNASEWPNQLPLDGCVYNEGPPAYDQPESSTGWDQAIPSTSHAEENHLCQGTLDQNMHGKRLLDEAAYGETSSTLFDNNSSVGSEGPCPPTLSIHEEVAEFTTQEMTVREKANRGESENQEAN